MSVINVYNKDCQPEMQQMKENQYDLVIVDPPYGIGQVWSKSRNDRFYKHRSSYTNKTIPNWKYFKELFRVSKNQIIWGGNYFTRFLAPSNHWLIWDKDRNYEKTFMSEIEMAWHSFSSPARIIKITWDGARKEKETGIKKIHPFQKPIQLYKWLLQNYAKPGNKILDTHGGSMSIVIACIELGFDIDIYEIDKDYFRDAKKRILNYASQLNLFNNKPVINFYD